MNWDAIGAIAELIGSIAVVFTLGYLAVQLRHSSKSTRLASAHGLANTYTEFLSQISSDPEVADLYLKAIAGEDDLTKGERLRFDALVLQMYRNADVHFHSYMDGSMTEELWDVTENGFIQIFQSPGGQSSWERQRHFISETFRTHIETKYGRPGGNIGDASEKAPQSSRETKRASAHAPPPNKPLEPNA